MKVKESINDMCVVTIYYSFDVYSPVYVFDTKQKAKDFIKKSYNTEIVVTDIEEVNLKSNVNSEDWSWARINYADNDFIEWSMGTMFDMREMI